MSLADKMKIKNVTRKILVAENAEVAKGFWKKSLGLMFRGCIKDGQCFLMEFKREGIYGIWMPCMRFPIDIIFLDGGKKVVGIFENIRPLGRDTSTWKVCRPAKPAKWILELKAGAANRKKISAGDRLAFINS